MPPPQKPLKRSRASYACDFCHRRGIRCKPAETPALQEEHSCQTCIEYGRSCTRNRCPKKRGTKPASKRAILPQSAGGLGQASSVSDGWSGSADETSLNKRRRTIGVLLNIYLDTVHPIFPLYCERNLWLGWRDMTFPNTRSEYRALMCMCALAAQHVDKGALFTDDIEAAQTKAELASELLQEAELLLPRHPEGPDLDLARCFGFLALRGTQARDGLATQTYLGLYHGIAAQLSLHDEARWPSDLTLCDRELRRRLWWSMYRLEVHTSCVLGGIIRSPEAQCRVDYPVGLHHPAFVPGRDGDFEDWFSGWNITTDLYRVLEHAILNCRSRNHQSRSVLGSYHPRIPSSVVTTRLSELQDQLMPQFRAAHSRSTDSGRNRCGFQASNILCTIYLAQMVSSVSSEAEFRSLCDTVGKMMELVESIPLEYVRAAGSLMVQQLAGVGYMLVTMARKRDLREADLIAFRSVFTLLVDFLNSIQDSRGEATAIVRRLEHLEASHQREALPVTLELPIQPIAKDANNAPLYFMFPLEEQDNQHQLNTEQDVFTRSLIMSFDLLERGSSTNI